MIRMVSESKALPQMLGDTSDTHGLVRGGTTSFHWDQALLIWQLTSQKRYRSERQV
jgi:hypothetical protein